MAGDDRDGFGVGTVNCWGCPSGVLAVPGVTASAAKTMEIVAVIALFAASVAVTVSVPADAGAV